MRRRAAQSPSGLTVWRGRVFRTAASLDAEASTLSSVASSQDSLHKQPKKKGIKSSIGRLFGKKEKGRLAHLAHRQVTVDPQGTSATRAPAHVRAPADAALTRAHRLLLSTAATTMEADAAGQDAGGSRLGAQAEKDRRLKKK